MILAIMLTSFLFISSSFAEDKENKNSKPSLSYYYFDGWVLCSKITVIVNDQKKKHNSKININTVKVGDGDSQKEIEKAKLKSHGIIAKDKSGKIITTVEGHSYGEAKVKEVIKLILSKPKE